MFRVGKFWLSLIGVCAAFAFFAQSLACFAEHAGLMPCHDETAQHDAGSPTKSKGDTDTMCCHLSCHQAFLISNITQVSLGKIVVLNFWPSPEIAPEAPAREIDHPPQLS